MKNIPFIIFVCLLFAGCSPDNAKVSGYIQSEPLSMAEHASVTMYPVSLAQPYNNLVAIANVTPASDKTTTDLFCFDIKTSIIQWKTVIENGTHGKLSYSGFEDAVYVRQDNKLKKLDLENGSVVWESAENIISVEKAFGDFVYCTGDSLNQETESNSKSLMAFDTKNGNLVWTSEVSLLFFNAQFGDFEIVFIDDLGSGNQLIVLDRFTGKVKKTIDRATFAGFNSTHISNIPYILEDKIFIHTPDKEVELANLGLPSQAKRTMAFIQSNIAMIGQDTGKSKAIDVTSGKVLAEPNFSVMDIVGVFDNVYAFKSTVGENNKTSTLLTAIDVTDGKTLWQTRIDATSRNIINLGDVIVYAKETGTLEILSIETGKPIQGFETGKTVYILSKLDVKTFIAVFNGNTISFWSK